MATEQFANNDVFYQSDIMEKHGWQPGKTIKIRDFYLTEGTHWWREGKHVVWTPEALDIVEASWEKDFRDKRVNHEEKNPLLRPVVHHPYLETGEVVEGVVKGICQNKSWVRVLVRGCLVTVKVPAKIATKRVGKKIRVAKVEDDSKTPTYLFMP